MAENENAQLRKEIGKLNQLLDIVLLRNAQIEQQLQAYTSAFAEVQTLLCSHPELKDKAKTLFPYMPKDEDIAKTPFPYMPESGSRAETPFPYMPGSENIAKTDYPYMPEEESMAKMHFRHIPASGKAIKTEIYSMPNEKTGSGSHFPPPILPDVEEIKNGFPPIVPESTIMNSAQNTMPAVITKAKLYNADILFNEVIGLMPTAKASGIENAVAIMLRLNQLPKQSMKDLQKLTGLSEDGMVKRIAAMKKLGLLTRQPGRGLVLTDKAINMLEASKQ